MGARGGRRLDVPAGRRPRPGDAGPAACTSRTAPRAIWCGSIPGEEWLYVLDGRLRLRLGDTVHELAPGDSAHFDSLTPHRIAAADPDGAELLFVHTLLQSPDPHAHPHA